MSDDLEKTLLVHLGALARRETWRVFELPEGITKRPAAILRLLDKRGWIEVRLWERVERKQRYFEDPYDFLIRPDDYIGWFSPLKSPRTALNWKDILEKYTGELAPEVRLTELGKLTLDEATVPGTKPEKKPGGRPADTDPGLVRRITAWVLDRTVTAVKWVFKHIVVQAIVGLIVVALVAWLAIG